MSVRSAQSVTIDFTTQRFDTGAATNADSTPAGTLVVNGTDNAATVTITNVTTGVYKAAVTLPTLAVGDICELRIAATVNSVAGSAVVWRDTKDIVVDSSGVVRADNRDGDAIPTAAGGLSQSDINNIGDRIAETLGDNPIQIQSPATGDNTLDIVQGVDYYTADGRDIEFPFIADYVPTSCKLTLVSGTVQTVTSTDITESSGSGSGRFSVRFQIPRATGDELEAGGGTFEVLSILSNGHEVPEISEGVLTVRRRRTA